MQRQLLEVLERRPAPVAQPAGAQFVFNNRGHDPNDLYERFRKRGPKEFTGQEDPLAADDWLEYTENIYEIFQCTGKQRVDLAASMFTGLADIWWKTVKAEYRLWQMLKFGVISRISLVTNMCLYMSKGKRPSSSISSCKATHDCPRVPHKVLEVVSICPRIDQHRGKEDSKVP